MKQMVSRAGAGCLRIVTFMLESSKTDDMAQHLLICIAEKVTDKPNMSIVNKQCCALVADHRSGVQRCRLGAPPARCAPVGASGGAAVDDAARREEFGAQLLATAHSFAVSVSDIDLEATVERGWSILQKSNLIISPFNIDWRSKQSLLVLPELTQLCRQQPAACRPGCPKSLYFYCHCSTYPGQSHLASTAGNAPRNSKRRTISAMCMLTCSS